MMPVLGLPEICMFLKCMCTVLHVPVLPLHVLYTAVLYVSGTSSCVRVSHSQYLL